MCPLVVAALRRTSKSFLSMIYRRTLMTSSGLISLDTPSVIRQNGKSRNGCFKKTKHAKFSEKRTLLTHLYAHVTGVLRKRNTSNFSKNKHFLPSDTHTFKKTKNAKFSEKQLFLTYVRVRIRG